MQITIISPDDWPLEGDLGSVVASAVRGQVEAEVRRLLGMWASGLDPVLFYNEDGGFVGIGADDRVVLKAWRWRKREAANYEEDEKTAYDTSFTHGFSDYAAFECISYRPEISYLIQNWPNASGAGYWDGWYARQSLDEEREIIEKLWPVSADLRDVIYDVPPGASPFVAPNRYRKD